MISVMRRGRRGLGVVLAVLAVPAVLGACGDDEPKKFKPGTAKFPSGAQSVAGGLTVTSSAFGDRERIPEKFSCKGDNVPPPLAWSGIPSGTTNVAIMVTDPDATKGLFVHWIVTGLPPSSSGSLTGARLPSGARTEPNSAGQAGYTGMCPPAGREHHYIFEVLALGTKVAFPAEATPQDKVRLLRAASSAGGKLTGTFGG
jgi:Raf kinase inhibitor-like YbhB/YbcL family protein